MRLRVGLPDISAALIVAVIIVMPPRPAEVHHAYRNPVDLSDPPADKLRDIARLQAALVHEPPDSADVDALVDLLGDVGQSDDAIRVATDALARGAEPAWQAELALASAYTERLEFKRALEWARVAHGNAAKAHQKVRIEVFIGQLERALAAIDDGIDPRRDSERFRDRVQQSRPPIRIQ